VNVWGNRIKLSIFGESHGRAVGVVVDGLPPGERIDPEETARDMRRRAPGGPLSTARCEADVVEVLSGIRDGLTTGFPICGVIHSSDARSSDYGTALRPGHADWTALLKFGGRADMRGGGHFSGRLTAPLVFAGSMARRILEQRGVETLARIVSIGGIRDVASPEGVYEFRAIAERDFPCSPDAEGAMKDEIHAAREDGDSVGGVVEAVAFGVPGGLGDPFFGSVESSVSSLMFSVPAVKGVEFGDGFRLASMRGGEANDALRAEDGTIRAVTNHNGGALGGITNGMPLVVRAAFKPTPSVALEQKTVDAATMENAVIRVAGRHDPCVVPRAVPVAEACLALCVLDAYLGATH
jgi:chorismate synthase